MCSYAVVGWVYNLGSVQYKDSFSSHHLCCLLTTLPLSSSLLFSNFLEEIYKSK